MPHPRPRINNSLMGDIAHELRTPVTVLRGYVDGLADGVFPASTETWSRKACRRCSPTPNGSSSSSRS